MAPKKKVYGTLLTASMLPERMRSTITAGSKTGTRNNRLLTVDPALTAEVDRIIAKQNAELDARINAKKKAEKKTLPTFNVNASWDAAHKADKPVSKTVAKPRTTASRSGGYKSLRTSAPAGWGLASLPQLPQATRSAALQSDPNVIQGDPALSEVYPGGRDISQGEREAIIQQGIEQNLLPEIAQTVMNPVYSTQAPQPPPQVSAYGLGTEPIPLTPQQQYLKDYLTAAPPAPFVPQPYVDTEVAKRPTWTPPEVYQDQPINKWAGLGALLAGLGGSPNIGVTAFKTLQGLNQEQNKINLDRSQRLADSIKQKYLYEIADSDFQQGLNESKAKTKNLNIEAANSAALKNLDAMADDRKNKASVADVMINNDMSNAQLADNREKVRLAAEQDRQELAYKASEASKKAVIDYIDDRINGQSDEYKAEWAPLRAGVMGGYIDPTAVYNYMPTTKAKFSYEREKEVEANRRWGLNYELNKRKEARAAANALVMQGIAAKNSATQAGSLNLRTNVAKAEGKLDSGQQSLFPRKQGADITPKGAAIPATLLPSGVSTAPPKGEKVMDGGSF